MAGLPRPVESGQPRNSLRRLSLLSFKGDGAGSLGKEEETRQEVPNPKLSD